MSPNRRRALIGVLCATVCSAARPAWSASGDLDPTFGSGGQVTLRFSTEAGSSDIGTAVVTQPDGRLVVGGTKGGSQMLLARLNGDGTLDAAFGTGGSSAPVDGVLSGLARQPDGKLVAIGNASVVGVVVARYGTDGVLDTGGFGAPAGVVVTQLPGSRGGATAVAIAPDGKIVLAGLVYDTTGRGYDIAVVRLNATGGLDGTFGTGGKVTTDVGGRDDAAFAVAVQPDGKIAVAGHAFNSFSNGYDVALVRYDTNGSPDGGFGTGGKVMTDLGTRDDRAFGLLVQPNGMLVVAGQTFSFDLLDVALVRYQANGTVDAAFGSGGTVVLAVSGGHDAARAIARQGDGKLVVAGYAAAGTNSDIAAARVHSDGSADATFGAGGTVVTAVSPQTDEASSVAIQPDGKIVLAGRTKVPFTGTFGGTGHQGAFVVVRYLP
jgi:uncharacterized delta-60 repeat protein